MTIRFLALAASFTPGQTIAIQAMTDCVAEWLRDGLAEIVREEPECATVEMPERAVVNVRRSR